MVEPAPPVGSLPVNRAIAPPSVELLGPRHENAAEIDPVVAFLQLVERLHLDGRVADDIQQGLVIPHILGVRRDVEIAKKNGGLAQRAGPVGHAR